MSKSNGAASARALPAGHCFRRRLNDSAVFGMSDSTFVLAFSAIAGSDLQPPRGPEAGARVSAAATPSPYVETRR
jgi:hypothetical protein